MQAGTLRCQSPSVTSCCPRSRSTADKSTCAGVKGGCRVLKYPASAAMSASLRFLVTGCIIGFGRAPLRKNRNSFCRNSTGWPAMRGNIPPPWPCAPWQAAQACALAGAVVACDVLDTTDASISPKKRTVRSIGGALICRWQEAIVTIDRLSRRTAQELQKCLRGFGMRRGFHHPRRVGDGLVVACGNSDGLDRMMHNALLEVGFRVPHDAGIALVLHDAYRRLRSEEHTSELQSPKDLVCRLLLEKKKKK